MSSLRRVLLCAALCALAASSAQAQVPELARVDSMIGGGRFSEARATLDRWLASPAGRNREGDAAAHALLLHARLTASADTALPLYLELALNHPASRHAPEALLRLGQGYLARTENDRAEGYLQRLLRDYPNAEQRGPGMLWLARVQHARRRTTEACRTITLALAAPSMPADVRALIEHENERCRGSAATTPAAAGASAGSSAAAANNRAAYTVQAGAFRDPAAARALVSRLRTRGIDARMVRIGEGSLINVRVGRFVTSNDAADVLLRVRAVVRDAVIASDVARERSITQ